MRTVVLQLNNEIRNPNVKYAVERSMTRGMFSLGFFMELDGKMERLGTKAETLERMYGKLNTAKVLSQFTFTVAEWKQH